MYATEIYSVETRLEEEVSRPAFSKLRREKMIFPVLGFYLARSSGVFFLGEMLHKQIAAKGVSRHVVGVPEMLNVCPHVPLERRPIECL